MADYLAQEAARTTQWEQAQEEEYVIGWSRFRIEPAWRQGHRCPEVEILPSPLLVKEEEIRRSRLRGRRMAFKPSFIFSSPLPHLSLELFDWPSEEDQEPEDELWFSPGPGSRRRHHRRDQQQNQNRPTNLQPLPPSESSHTQLEERWRFSWGGGSPALAH